MVGGMRPFTFLADAREPMSGPKLAEVARRAEATGFHALVIPDHLIPQLSPVAAMATIAAATTTLRIGTFVFNNDLRHPAVLAQDMASLDVLSGGRLDIGVGAGWNRKEYDAIGLAFESVGTRVARLTESVAVLKGCFAEGPFSFAGEHYTITDYEGGPRPVQQPHPPFMIGGGGRRVLTLAGREADIVGLAPRARVDYRVDPRSITFEATAEKIAWVREAAGDRFDALSFNIYPTAWPVAITDDVQAEAASVIEYLAGRTGIELTETEVLDSPHLFIGSIDMLVEKFQSLRERLGISSITVGGVDDLTPVVERLAGT